MGIVRKLNLLAMQWKHSDNYIPKIIHSIKPSYKKQPICNLYSKGIGDTTSLVQLSTTQLQWLHKQKLPLVAGWKVFETFATWCMKLVVIYFHPGLSVAVDNNSILVVV